MIKNSHLIKDKIHDFTLQNIEFIVGFYLNFQNCSIEDTSYLDIDFLVKDKKKEYIASFRFYNPSNINFESGGIFHTMSVAIYDISDRGWGNKKYEVIDYEEDSLHFYCTDMEVMSIKETHYNVIRFS